VAEGLRNDLLESKSLGAFKSIKIDGSLYLSHLIFMNDILLFYYGYRRDALKLKDILDLYSIAIGMKINIHKSITSFLDFDEDNFIFLFELFPLE
jgi:hypothetical protein